MRKSGDERDATIAHAVWDGDTAPARLAADVVSMEALRARINYVALRKGTVVLVEQRDDPGGNDVNTWRIVYAISGSRDQLFKQHR